MHQINIRRLANTTTSLPSNLCMLNTEGNRLQKLLKEELRMTIMAKRHARGQGDLKVEFPDPKPHQLTMAEQERRERRREQNRRAAQRCRRKKRMNQMSVLQNYEWIVSHNHQLQQEVDQLRQEKNQLQSTLKAHCDACTCTHAHTLLSHALSSPPAVKVEPAEEPPASSAHMSFGTRPPMGSCGSDSWQYQSADSMMTSCSLPSTEQQNYNGQPRSYQSTPFTSFASNASCTPRGAFPAQNDHMNLNTQQSNSPNHMNLNTTQANGPNHMNLSSPQSNGPNHMNLSSPQCNGPNGPNHMNLSSPRTNGLNHMNLSSPQTNGPNHVNLSSPQNTSPSHVSRTGESSVLQAAGTPSQPVYSSSSGLTSLSPAMSYNLGPPARDALSVSMTNGGSVSLLDELAYIPNGLRACVFQEEAATPLSADGRRSISSVSSDVSTMSEQHSGDVSATSLEDQAHVPARDLYVSDDVSSNDVSQLLSQINQNDLIFQQGGGLDEVFTESVVNISSLQDHFLHNLDGSCPL